MENILRIASGEEVRDRPNSHLHNGIVSLLPEALLSIEAKGRNFIVEEIDMGRIIGETICVATRPSDTVVYAKRPKRFGLTRFVKDRQAEPCQSVVVILKKAEDANVFILITAFVGSMAEPEPWDRNATKKSYDFWNSHALVWGKEEIITGTETTRCPW